MDQYINAIQQSVAQNNAWSAEQAQKQMDFQREMSNTAHQREIADLKAAGLNPVLSAKLGGASTPNGAMASGDTSGTSALVDLLQLSLETANSAAGAARAAASTVQDNSASNIEGITQEQAAGADLWHNGDKDTPGSRDWLTNIGRYVPAAYRWVVGAAIALGDFVNSSPENIRAAEDANGKLNGTYRHESHPSNTEDGKKVPFIARVLAPFLPKNYEGLSNYLHESSNSKLVPKGSRKASPFVHSAKQSQLKY